MLLQRCIDHWSALRLTLVVGALLVSGCASSGPKSTTGDAADTTVAGESAETPQFEISDEALTMFEEAASVMASGDYLDAELHFKEFLMRYPGYPGAYVNLAIIHLQNGNEVAAQAELDSALALNPTYPPALNQQGMLLRRNGKFFEAEAAYLKAVTASPDYALAHYNLGVLNELYLRRLETALQHFERYQLLVGQDEQVGKWIADLRRRVATSQRTANVAE